MIILHIALPLPVTHLFDYLPPIDIDQYALVPGIRVRVLCGSRLMVGILVLVDTETTLALARLRRALAILDRQPIFPDELRQLCLWASHYYHYSLGSILLSALPSILRQGKSIDQNKLNRWIAKLTPPKCSSLDSLPVLNEAQQQAVSTIVSQKNDFNVFLLYGVTSSGKTEVYLRIIAQVLQENQQVLVLVPEINLTPQLLQRFRIRFNIPIAIMHSGLSNNERLAVWQASYAGSLKIVIGTRSGIFIPFAKLGLIVVDEEHDVSFKQQDHCRYHARDLGIIRARFNQRPIILGSATPSLESLQNVRRGSYRLLFLPKRAGQAVLPTYHLLDLRAIPIGTKLSQPLLQMMHSHLQEGNQVLLFLNRRGFAPILYCSSCRWIAQCKHCDSRLVYHRLSSCLKCHYCGAQYKIVKHCQQCNQSTVCLMGMGTERLETILKPLFPDIPLIRMDRDNTQSKGALCRLLEEIHQNPCAILMGTQMLSKGHHFPQVTLVGVIDADNGLFSADFRAVEHLGQQLCQIAGRAGRADKPGRVFIQTRYVDHPYFNILLTKGYLAFAQQLLLERKQVLLPPYAYLVALRVEARRQSTAVQFLNHIRTLSYPSEITVCGPLPRLHARYKQWYRLQLLFKATCRQTLQRSLRALLPILEQLGQQYAVKWIVEVDPLELL